MFSKKKVENSIYKSKNQVYTLTIAGLDPTAGAGLLADIKTFQATGSYGFAVATCLTAQTENKCVGAEWFSLEQLKMQIEPLLSQYQIGAIKIGAFKSVSMLIDLIDWIKSIQKQIKFIWDPVIKTSSGYVFLNIDAPIELLLPKIDIITPNLPELLTLANETMQENAIQKLSLHTNILLTGGHINESSNQLVDSLFAKTGLIKSIQKNRSAHQKHGSGCVFSAAYTSYLAQDYGLGLAFEKASLYMVNFFESSDGMLGMH